MKKNKNRKNYAKSYVLNKDNDNNCKHLNSPYV